MEAGRQKNGVPSCYYASGCMNPMPELTEAESMALDVFFDCFTQWHRASGGFSVVRTGLDYRSARVVAEARGVAWTWPLLKRLQACERAVLSYDSMTRERESVRSDNARAAGIVN